MCGICGELSISGRKVSPENIGRMADSIAHRGPDDSGIYCSGPIGLGHRRLSIIDLSENGKQPMWSSDRSLCIVYNGEVYNFQEIRRDLLAEGYHFSSTTDTEVVVHAIQCWGIEKALSKFIGMFAFAVWDSREQRLVLCRDRAGIKPLYYYLSGDTFLFGSEMKSLLAHPGFKRELNRAALGQYFVIGYCLNDYTVFNDTFKLSPGHYMTMDRDGAMSIHRYWGLDDAKRGSFKGGFNDAAEQLEELLVNAFEYRLVSDVPVGLFLSGGIDSSLVSSILKKKVNADILNITIGFREQDFDESPKAKKVSDELGVNHIVHYISPTEAQDTLEKFCDIYDEPFSDTSGIPTFILSRLARQHVKVALSADGGDEQFCGYESYPAYINNYNFVTRFPGALRLIASKVLGGVLPYRQLLSWKLARADETSYTPQSIARYEKMVRLLEVNNEKSLIQLMNEKAWSRATIGEFLPVGGADIFRNTTLSDDCLGEYKDGMMDAMMRTDYCTFLRDDILVKTDRASMSVSLECRDPFLDHRIAELAFSLPVSYLFDRGEHKRILKVLLRQWIGESVISSPKRGFMIPLYYWLRGIWKPFVMEYLSRRRIRSVGVLDEVKVEKEVDRFYRYHGCRAEKIWTMLNFQMWAEKWYLHA